MLGLRTYESSDEEEEASKAPVVVKEQVKQSELEARQSAVNGNFDAATEGIAPEPVEPSGSLAPSNSAAPTDEAQIGPSKPGPDAPDYSEGSLGFADASYATPQQAIQNLTLPPVPNFEIPPSPPGSPSAGASEKFERFLALKKKGVHFNEKLENSTALRNPTSLQKLRGFADIDDEEQYASSLPPELAVRTKFPDWAYADQLNKLQAETLRRKEKEKALQQRDAIDFQPASVTAPRSAASSRDGTPGASGKAGGKSAAERVMAGLDGDWSSSASGSKRGAGGLKRAR